MIFEDTFNVFNESSWTAENAFDHTSSELQVYLSDNVRVSDGHLILTTRFDPEAARAAGSPRNYTSGWVSTKGKFQQKFGRFVVRAKAPRPLPQMWPALWLMPDPAATVPENLCWPAGGEIDVMEIWGGRYGNRSFSSLHWTAEGGDEPTHCGSAYDESAEHVGQFPANDEPPIDFSLD